MVPGLLLQIKPVIAVSAPNSEESQSTCTACAHVSAHPCVSYQGVRLRGWSGVSPGITVVCLSSQLILDVARCHSGGDRPLALCLRHTRDLG